MALVKPSGLITDIVGSVGGTTFQRSRYGLIAKNKGSPSVYPTPPQAQKRSIFSFLNNYWREILSDDLRIGWNTYAANTPWLNKFGDTVYLKGFNHFIRINSVRICGGYSLRPSAPEAYGLAVQPGVDTDNLVYIPSGIVECYEEEPNSICLLSSACFTNINIQLETYRVFVFTGYQRLTLQSYYYSYKYIGRLSGIILYPHFILIPYPMMVNEKLILPSYFVCEDLLGRHSRPEYAQLPYHCTPEP